MNIIFYSASLDQDFDVEVSITAHSYDDYEYEIESIFQKTSNISIDIQDLPMSEQKELSELINKHIYQYGEGYEALMHEKESIEDALADSSYDSLIDK